MPWGRSSPVAATSIEWADEVWNPTVGCSIISEGCRNCYAMKFAHRGITPRHRGLTELGKHGPRWNGIVRFVPEVLAAPLGWKKPRRVFVNSMSDLFHDGVSNEQIASVFGVMASCPQHHFLVLTKRPSRMVSWFAWPDCRRATLEYAAKCDVRHVDGSWANGGGWPLPNVWLGVSAENQATADERVPLLLETPAAIRWVSYEPALGPVDFHPGILGDVDHLAATFGNPLINWIVVGGESGAGARPFDIAWARSVVRQGADAGAPVFVKQLGARPEDSNPPPGYGRPLPGLRRLIPLTDRKGGDMAEWPVDLRVRQFPVASRLTTPI